MTYPQAVLTFSGLGLVGLGVIALMYGRKHQGRSRERLDAWGISGADSGAGLVIAVAITAIANLLPLWVIGLTLLMGGGGLILLGLTIH